MNNADKTRFWSKVKKGEGCWLWTAGKDGGGYGAFLLAHNKQSGAHRVAYALLVGPIPDGLILLHSCDVPACVNPEHLTPGTRQANRADCVAKGRQARGATHGSVTHPERVARGDRHASRTQPDRIARGDRHGSRVHIERRPRGSTHANAKIDEATAARIRARAATGERHIDIAISFGISRPTVQRIAARTAWRHV